MICHKFVEKSSKCCEAERAFRTILTTQMESAVRAAHDDLKNKHMIANME
jgi:hypothetical protein